MFSINRRPVTCPEAVVCSVLALLFFVLLGSAFAKVSEKGFITKSIFNCRQIILSLRLYAADEGGHYPDSDVPGATHSNEVFRQLLIKGDLEDEKIFGCGVSRFTPDGIIGSAPDFAQAVEPGENHWAMTKGSTDSAPDRVPLVFENPIEASWNPAWNGNAIETREKGRVWKGGKVIIGTNDTSVELMKLASTTGPKVRLKPFGDDEKNLFAQHETTADGTNYEVLDIARSPTGAHEVHKAPLTGGDYMRIIFWLFVVLLGLWTVQRLICRARSSSSGAF